MVSVPFSVVVINSTEGGCVSVSVVVRIAMGASVFVIRLEGVALVMLLALLLRSI